MEVKRCQVLVRNEVPGMNNGAEHTFAAVLQKVADGSGARDDDEACMASELQQKHWVVRNDPGIVLLTVRVPVAGVVAVCVRDWVLGVMPRA